MPGKKHGHVCDGCGCRWYHDPDKFNAAKWRRYPESMACAQVDTGFLYMLHHLCPRCGRPQYQKAEYHHETTQERRRDMGEVEVANAMRDIAPSVLPPKFRGEVQRIVDMVEPPSVEDRLMMLLFGVIKRRLRPRPR